MNRTELLERLDGTEWVDFEVKSAQGGVPVDAFKTLSAFANSGGGWLVFGVGEGANGYEIHGIVDVDRFQNDLLSTCRSPDKLRRPASIHPRLYRFDEGWVLALRVDEAPRWDDRELCEGHLVSALRSLFERFHRLCPQPFALEPEGPLPLRRARGLEEQALREALLNLVAHQDYADVQRTATILWWSDRVVFYNPGDSYVATEDLWTGGFSETRNPLIARVLRQAGLAEQAGSGLPLIRRTWAETGRPAPELRNDGGRKRFEMTFRWGEERRVGPGGVSGGVGGVSGGVIEGVKDRAVGTLAKRLLGLITAEPGLRVPALHTRLGASKRSVERTLGELKAARFVVVRGAPKTGGYYATGTDKPDANA